MRVRGRGWGAHLLMIVFVACIGGLAVATATGPREALAAAPDSVGVRLMPPGDSISITGYFHLTGNIGAVDSIRSTLEQPVGVVFTAAILPPTATTVTYKMARPATAISGKVCITTLYVGTSTITPNSCAAWSYTPPGAIADSVKVARLWLTPRTSTVLAGGTIQFCTFIVFADSMVAMRDQDALSCARHYQMYIPADRQVYGAGARQQAADAMCIEYEATGGTITSEACGSGGKGARPGLVRLTHG